MIDHRVPVSQKEWVNSFEDPSEEAKCKQVSAFSFILQSDA